MHLFPVDVLVHLNVLHIAQIKVDGVCTLVLGYFLAVDKCLDTAAELLLIVFRIDEAHFHTPPNQKLLYIKIHKCN